MEIKRLRVGKITSTHGLKGDLKVYTDSDDYGEIFAKNKVIYLEIAKKIEEFKIVNYRYLSTSGRTGHIVVIRLANLEDINLVEKYKGCFVMADIPVSTLDANESFYIDLIDSEVFNENDKYLGKVIRIFDNGAQDILVIENKNKKMEMIPYISQFIIEEDLAKKKIVIKTIKGLIDED